jgi:DNA-binding MarR family transcriptional regulator
MTKAAEDLLEGIRVILRTFTINETRYPAAEGRIKYNAIDFQALHFIEKNPGCMGTQLAQFLGVAPTTVQSVCDRLIRRGFLEKNNHKNSKRAVAYQLTHEGEEVARAIYRQDIANCHTMLSALPPKERRQFAAQILQIAENLSEPDSE